MQTAKIPPYLKRGQTIGITCPAGYMAREKVEPCIKILQGWGFEVMVGRTVGSDSANYFSGTDEQRRDELQAMLDDKDIHAILFGRGGYGMSRIIDNLDFKKFRKNPKWLIGYSDITVMHNHLLRNFNIASLHAPMAGAFNETVASEPYLSAWHRAITGKKAAYSCPSSSYNRRRETSGRLVGGNLALLAHCVGTPSDLVTKNSILFIEDIGEYLYNIDRMLIQLKRSGKFENLLGLIIGGFTDMKDTERPFGKTLESLVLDIVAEFDFPVCFNFPVSHTHENLALKIGVEYSLKVGRTLTRLKEL